MKTTNIGHPAQSHDEFQQELRELGRLVTRYGIDACQPRDGDRIAMAVFINKVHEGWKQAQNVAIRLYFEISDEIETVKGLVKACNRTRQRDGLAQFKESLKVLEYRRRKVQHAVDAIVWSVYQNKDWILRRFWLDGAHTNIGRYELLQTMQIADELNRVATKLAIACDLTTFMKVGDLVVLDLMNKELQSGSLGQEVTTEIDWLRFFWQFSTPAEAGTPTFWDTVRLVTFAQDFDGGWSLTDLWPHLRDAIDEPGSGLSGYTARFEDVTIDNGVYNEPP